MRARTIATPLALCLFIISVILLLNFTAPNPTGRRYSSATPRTTGQGSANELGGDGERILGSDLHLPNNNESNQRKCVCSMTGSTPPGDCNVCLSQSPLVENYRIPDFVGRDFIAEAKNVRQLLVSHDRDFQQISAFADAARATGRAFWLYVRVDTFVEPPYAALFDGIKGGIVYYFSVPGYVDTVDQLASIGLAVAILVLIVILISALLRPIRPVSVSRPPRRRRTIDPVGKLNEAEDFLRRARERARREMDNLHDDSDN